MSRPRCSIFPLALVLAVAAGLWLTHGRSAAQDDGLRTWSDVNGRTLNGQLLAYDRIRATLRLDGGHVVFVRPASLSEADRKFLAEWRSADPQAPWVDPLNMPPWPSEAGAGAVKVIAVKADGKDTRFVYHSPHFEVIADVQLPLDTVAEMATAFEATRSAILSLPLGLGAAPVIKIGRGFRLATVPAGGSDEANDPGKASPRLRAELFMTPQAYGLAGGASGTGGYYSSWRRSMLISLDNFGIGADNGRVTLDYRDKLFIIRHEVSHQVMAAWLPLLPVWLHEGMAEYLAALPYQGGRYRFRDIENPFVRYLNKWRFEEDPRIIPMRHPDEMFDMTGQQWQAALSLDTPVLNYNSAALLAWYFLHQDDDGKGAHLAAYFNTLLRAPESAGEAVAKHLLRGRTPDQIAAEIRAGWKTHGIDIVVE